MTIQTLRNAKYSVRTRGTMNYWYRVLSISWTRNILRKQYFPKKWRWKNCREINQAVVLFQRGFCISLLRQKFDCFVHLHMIARTCWQMKSMIMFLNLSCVYCHYQLRFSFHSSIYYIRQVMKKAERVYLTYSAKNKKQCTFAIAH